MVFTGVQEVERHLVPDSNEDAIRFWDTIVEPTSISLVRIDWLLLTVSLEVQDTKEGKGMQSYNTGRYARLCPQTSSDQRRRTQSALRQQTSRFQMTNLDVVPVLMDD